MNKHIFIDRLTAMLGSAASGKNRFFSNSVESPGYKEHLDNISLTIPEISEGRHEVPAASLAGEVDPAFYVSQLKGKAYPTILYHHGNNERPFDFRKYAKNSFKTIFLDAPEPLEANIIALRAPFHNNTLKQYQQKITDLSNFMALLCTSVELIEAIVQKLKKEGYAAPILTSGISLGGWVTNLHRSHHNTTDIYAPLLAGAALDDLFTESIYRKMAGKAGRENPEALRNILNFEADFEKIKDGNVFPLLGRYDQFIRYERQKRCYGNQIIQTIDKGHVTSLLNADLLRNHLLSLLEP